MYRNCCARLQSSFAFPRTRQAFAVLRQNHTRPGSIATRRYSTAPESQPNSTNTHDTIVSQLHFKKDASAMAPLPALEFGSEAYRQHMDDIVARDLQTAAKNSPGPRRNAKTQKKRIHHRSKLHGAPRGMPAWRKTPDEKAAYLQWGYLRHRYTPEELPKAKRKFNDWKTKLCNITTDKERAGGVKSSHGKWLYELGDIASMRRSWEKLDVDIRERTWERVMLSTLRNCPLQAGRVLAATLDPLPPGYVIADTMLHYLQAVNLDDIKSPRDRSSTAEEMVELLSKIVLDLPAKHVSLRQYTLALLANKLPLDQVAEVYQIMRQADLKLHWHTRLNFARVLSETLSHKDTAYEILQSLVADSIDLNTPIVASIITKLLHERDKDTTSSNSFSPQRAMEFFLENGYSPNLASFTALVDSLCKQGDVTEAMRLPLLLAESGADLDKRCYEIVFRGAKSSLKASNVVQALDVAKAANAPYIDVLNNGLHSVFYFAEMECREKRQQLSRALPLFTPLLGIYSKAFDLKPLQWLVPDLLPLLLEQGGDGGAEKFGPRPGEDWDFAHSILPVVRDLFESSEGPRLQPSSTTLAIMLRAYIRSLQRPYDVMSFYSFFKARLEDGDAERNWAVEVVKEQGSIIHDSLILAMMEHRALLRPALQVFGDMLRASGASKDGAPAVHPRPNLFTFNIVIHGLFLRREGELAGQVLQVLGEHNLEPNHVTWNTLVKGYALMQNRSKTVGTLQELEAAGFQPDAYTYRAFARLHDQNRALQMMERIIYTNMKRLEEEEEEKGPQRW